MQNTFAYLTGALTVAMIVPYIRDILHGKTRPERGSWFIWSVLGGVALASQFAKGAQTSLWLPGGQTAAVIVILVLSIRHGVGGITRRDLIALAAAAIGVGLWLSTSEPLIALWIVILTNVVGTGLTIAKTYADPDSETLSTWVLSGLSGITGMFAVDIELPSLVIYPIYITVSNLSVAGVILWQRRPTSTESQS